MTNFGQGRKRKYKVLWSKESKRQFEKIAAYLKALWTEREVDKFAERLKGFEKLVAEFPELYAESKIRTGLRRAVSRNPIPSFTRSASKTTPSAFSPSSTTDKTKNNLSG